ncbi:MAG: hypothetical protein CL768_00130 [Chloroflexi bacterium]|nr:hypothetical protein [Chloroflexota bacterium]
MLRLPTHTPFKNGEGGVKVGLEPIEVSEWLEIDDLFTSEIEQKKELYKNNFENIYQANVDSKEPQLELFNTLSSHIDTYHAGHTFSKEGFSFLHKASLMVQEDLVLMIPNNKQYFLGAASLCSPSNWSLMEKFNKSLLNLHEYVPSYKKKIGSRVDNFFTKLPPDRIFQRFNWSIYEDPSLYQPARSKAAIERSKNIDSSNAGESLFLRVERQTVRKLPETLSVVFTIRVHVDPLCSIESDLSLIRDLKLALDNLSNNMKIYKSIDQIEGPLKKWLNKKIKNLS